MKFTSEETERLEWIKACAKLRHEKARKAAKARGRVDFPLLPFECSWAFEEQFRKNESRN